MTILRDARAFATNKLGLPSLLTLLAAFLFAVQAMAVEIPLHRHGGVYTLQVGINDVYTAPFILDSGASEVTIPADVALSLLRAGTISNRDFLPEEIYRLADGSIVVGSRFNIREIEVGGFRVFNVPAMVVPVTGSLLLGQSFLSRAGHWAIDNERPALVLSGSATTTQEAKGKAAVLSVILFFLAILLPLSLRRRYPRKVWIGILLAIIFGPLGQLYLEGAIWYFLGLAVLFPLFKVLIPEIAWLSVSLLSGTVMYYRLLKVEPLASSEDKGSAVELSPLLKTLDGDEENRK